MDQLFKKIIQKTKAWNQGVEPVSKTFEGALFKDSGWVFAFDESVSTVASSPMKKEAEKPIEAPNEAPKITKLKPDALSLVLFIGDTHVDGNGEDLLGKMIHAMKLVPGEFNRVTFDEELENIEDLAKNLSEPSIETARIFSQIKKYKPQVVVSLGATVTNILLGKRDKLSGIHGQFFPKVLNLEGESHSYELLPLFHPEFLIINPNMKRTAWIDLQKVMELIGKN